MDENLNQLEDRLLDTLENTDFDYIEESFGALDGPTMVVGSGGSSASSKFVASVINEKNGIISEPKLPDEVRVAKNSQYKNMIIVSSSGINYGAQKASEKAIEDGVNVKVLSGSDKLSKEDNIIYSHTLSSENSFIAFASTLAPMVIALAYYLGDKQKAIDFVKEVFAVAKKNPIDFKEMERNVFQELLLL